MSQYILAIDQGTTSTRAILFNEAGTVQAQAQLELKQYFPQNGWVEHDPLEIWHATERVMKEVVAKSQLKVDVIAAIGITNQRETTILWDKNTGEPLYKAIVWQDRRTASLCDSLRAQQLENQVRQKTGLLLDPYFSATKLAWLLDNVPQARARAAKGELAFGTIDSFLIWHLTGGKEHVTDATNASRTMLFNIHSQTWDAELLNLFNIPEIVLPKVLDNSSLFGVTTSKLLGKSIPITGVAGDQQAATFGQACFAPGMVKSTYGTGCFMMLNTGNQVIQSSNRLLTTVAYRLNNQITYALEGSIFIAGAAVQWLRDALKIIHLANETENLAASLSDNGGVYLVPAFTGLGAPHWDANARGAIFGLTRDTGAAHIARATLESVCYQTNDLLMAFRQDGIKDITTLRVDGGMVVNNWLLQFLADVLAIPVIRARVTQTSALGAAYLAGLQVGIYDSLTAISGLWQAERSFNPSLDKALADRYYQGWQRAVGKTRSGQTT